MNNKADLFPRFLAALIDSLIGWVFVVIPIVGAIVSVLYLLFKDALPYQVFKEDKWKNKSIGKEIMNIKIDYHQGEVVDMTVSAKRNIPLTIGSLITIIPLLGWVIGPIVGLIFAIIELVLIVTDSDSRRLGDRWGNTTVIADEVLEAEEIQS